MAELVYLSGFGNEHETEALEGALPVGQFSPQRCPYGLYAEQISTSAFTAPRHANRRTWMYRMMPSVSQGEFHEISQGLIRTAPFTDTVCPHNPMRWDPQPENDKQQDFIDSLTTVAANGDARTQLGFAIHLYNANQDMEKRYFYSADGEILIIPQEGDILIATEMGKLMITPGEIAVIPRGIKFKVTLPSGKARGYLCENYGAVFELPERGPVGANGFANDRDFLYPSACFEGGAEENAEKETEEKEMDGESTVRYQVIAKFCGRLFTAELDHSPLNVVAWTGNSAPYKYDLSRFNVINSVSFDHCDPSIFTVLTSPSHTLGMANADFVIFPPRWIVSENTFRPPWFHRNIMSEFMGLVKGQYDAKQSGFTPGGMSLHNCMTPHGPDAATFNAASSADLKPAYQGDTLAFMLESRYPIIPTEHALSSPQRQQNYSACWDAITNQFQHPIQNPNQNH